ESCGTCHIPIPPEVLPTETWERILENPGDHYGQRLEPPVGPVILLMWNYLRTFSRSVLEKESVPAFVSKSRYFRALHPQVSFADPVSHRTCYECHPGAQQLNYRQINISAN
ncbi:MAG: cytochrome C, partial [Cyanobacteria bacterium P01_H01_bin.15]